MLLHKIIKNTINNSDYFRLRNDKLRKSETYRNIAPFSNNGKIQNNRYYIHKNNLEKNFEPNNNSTHNCFGKYKDRIINKFNLVQPNSQTLNKFLNIKSSTFKYPMRNDINNTFKTVGNRIYKVDSEDNIFHNKFYLSEKQKYDENENEDKNIQNQSNNNNNYIPNRYFDKRKTDITDNSIIEISNNKQSYVDYKNKILEYRDINREISEQNKNFHEKRIFNNRLKEQDDINRVNNYYNSMAAQNLIDEKNKKFQYRFSLDEQIKNNLDNKLRNENISYNDVFQSKNYLPKINRPKLIEINPYKHRNYFLGNSQLRHNIITNPLSMYKINKYFFPRNDVDELNY